MRIAIVGNPGSGKSTLAIKLHEILNISVYHLDQHYWKPGWQRPDPQEFAEIHKQLCDKEEWIIEGCGIRLFEYRTQKADIIIFLDIPLYVALYRVYKRALTGLGTIRATSAKGCPERMPDFQFLKYIWNFNKKHKPQIEAILEKCKNQKKIFIVKTLDDLNKLIKTVKSKYD